MVTIKPKSLAHPCEKKRIPMVRELLRSNTCARGLHENSVCDAVQPACHDLANQKVLFDILSLFFWFFSTVSLMFSVFAANDDVENLARVRCIANWFEENEMLVWKAKNAVNNERMTRSLTAIQSDYSNAPKMITVHHSGSIQEHFGGELQAQQ